MEHADGKGQLQGGNRLLHRFVAMLQFHGVLRASPRQETDRAELGRFVEVGWLQPNRTANKRIRSASLATVYYYTQTKAKPLEDNTPVSSRSCTGYTQRSSWRAR